jgi:hypothetical protein
LQLPRRQERHVWLAMTMLCSWWFSSVGVSRRLKYFRRSRDARFRFTRRADVVDFVSERGLASGVSE